MTHFRSFALAAALSALALPALAQNAAPDVAAPATGVTAPSTTAAPAATAVPDTGMKKASPAVRSHHRAHRTHAHSAAQTVPPTQTK